VRIGAGLTLEQRRDVIADAACAAGVVTTLRADGDTLTTARRDELLAACAAGKYVELELDMQSFEQQPGVRMQTGAHAGSRGAAA